MFKTNIDSRRLTSKPNTEKCGSIRNSLYQTNKTKELTVNDLAKAIENGQTLTAAVMGKTTKDGWKEQSLIIADIDNDSGEQTPAGDHIPIKDPLTPKEALTIMQQNEITPALMYYTWNNRTYNNSPRFRIILVMDKPIADQEQAEAIGKKFIYMFNRVKEKSADTASSQTDRMFTGSVKGSVFFKSQAKTTIETLERLPEDPEEETPPREYRKPEYIKGGKLEEMETALQDRINNFDLAGWISNNTNSRIKGNSRARRVFFNPCPVCGHNDCFNVTGSVYYCQSDHHKHGGNIIEFLKEYNHMSYGEARDFFKFEICGENKEEWINAYKEEQKARTAQNTSTTEPEAKPESEVLTFIEQWKSEKFRPYETGLKFFDDLLSGGIMRQSLVLLLAAPAAGKTTLCQQIATEIAARKNPVIYLNFEMSREQMIAKILSARIFQKNRSVENIITALDILQGYKWTEEQERQIREAAEEYRTTIEPYLSFKPESIGTDNAELKKYLEEQAEAAKKNGQEAPAVVVDYLQLLKVPGMEIKEALQQILYTLKEYANRHYTFVIGVSAKRRDKDSKKITMDSGRDSSNIEYSADYMLGLNYYDIEVNNVKKDDEIEEMKRENPRRMALTLLKGRMIKQKNFEELYYYPGANIFYSDSDEFLPVDPERVPFNNKSRPQTKIKTDNRI